MAYNISAFAGAGAQFFDNNGDPLSGGKLYVYTAGTTTPATTWTNNSGAVPNTNPIVLDSAGRTPFEIWLNSGVTYKFVLKTSADVLIGTYDNIPAIDDPTVFNNLISVTYIAGALIGTSVPPRTAYVAGMTVSFIPSFTNIGPLTLDLDGLGQKNIYIGSSTSLSGGEVVAGRIVQLEYDGTRFQLYQSTIANTGVTPGSYYKPTMTVNASGQVTAISSNVDPVVNVQTFNSTGTWTKPTGAQTMARVQIWGAGGGGSRSASANSTGGGGGGGYFETTVPISQLNTQTVVIGSGGAGATVAGNGSAGGASYMTINGTSFGAGGGGPGGIYSTVLYGGGGGTITTDMGSSGTGGVGNPGTFKSVYFYTGSQLGLGAGDYSGMAGAGAKDGGTTYPALSGVIQGGGGGAGSSVQRCVGAGSIYGGGGGGCGIGGVWGQSVYGGVGGANGTDGVAPGGGGGASTSANVNGGNGAAGRIVITCW